MKPRAARNGLQISTPVFLPAVVLIFLFVAVTLTNAEDAAETFQTVQTAIAENGGWFFVLTVNLILGFCFFLIFSRFGKIRIGGPNALPDFSRWAWFSMLYSAGMGIGLVFFAVAEPIMHYTAPPIEPFGPTEKWERAQEAMGLTFLHWGLHPWAIYALLGLALAYAGFNKGLPLSIRSVFYPILGQRIYGPIGHGIDVLATVATLFGVATSLGFGVSQINAGLSVTLGIESSLTAQLWLIAFITLLATGSVVSGLDHGIKRLSELNIILAGALMLFVLFAGPTLFIFNGFAQNIGYYLQNFPRLATWGETYTGTHWQNNWTVFYYAWWIAWSPFVGMFIARISKGRTIREFVLAVLIVPSLVGFLWLTVFGNGALAVELYGQGGIAAAVKESVPQALFTFLDSIPFAGLTALVATFVVVTFFVTSSDSGSLVIDIITAGGALNPPVAQRIFWALTEGIVAAVLLIGGGLAALQTAAITTGFPFAFILLLTAYSLYKALKEDLPNAASAGS
ncbi:MAG: BCCT family transporter [Rhodospirillales bacterium]